MNRKCNVVSINEIYINFIRRLTQIKKSILNSKNIFERLSNIEVKLSDYDQKFDNTFNELQKTNNSEFKQKIFFAGQVYDSYTLIVDIIKRADRKIVIIDNYIDDSVLKMLTKKNKRVEVKIVTSNKSNIINLDVIKFNKEYPTLKVIRTNKFHDRFIVIDDKELYHVGASLKDLGKKCCAISKFDQEKYIKQINQYI